MKTCIYYLFKSFICYLSVGLFARTVLAGSDPFSDHGLYKVSITKNRVEPASQSEDVEVDMVDKKNYEIMLNRRGRPFRCQIPPIVAPLDSNNKLVDLTTEKIEKALAPVDSSRACLQLVTSAWWHYEFCYNERVSQYHMDGGVIVAPVISLGTYSHSYDWNNVSVKEVLKRKERFHVQYYVNGTACDLTDRRRETRVKFFCDNSKWSNDYIYSAHEPESCVYELIVFTRRLCAINYFAKDEPIVSDIVCDPLNVKEKLLEFEESPVKSQRNLMDDLFKKAAIHESGASTEKFEEIDIVAGESDSDFAIKDELRDAAEKITEKLFENAKYFLDNEAAPSSKLVKPGQKKLNEENMYAKKTNRQQKHDPKTKEKQSATASLVDATVGEEPVGYVDSTKQQMLSGTRPWMDRSELAKAFIHIDFASLGELSSAEKKVVERFTEIIRILKRLTAEEEETRKTAYQDARKQYDLIADRLIQGDDISARFKAALREVFFMLTFMMQQYNREYEREHLAKVVEKSADMSSYAEMDHEDVEITESLLSDTEMIRTAIRNLDFASLDPLNMVEEAFLEAVQSLNKESAELQELGVENDIYEELSDSIQQDLVRIKKRMDKSQNLRPQFKRKLDQLIRLKLALLAHDKHINSVQAGTDATEKQYTVGEKVTEHATVGKDETEIDSIQRNDADEPFSSRPFSSEIETFSNDMHEAKEHDKQSEDENEIMDLLLRAFAHAAKVMSGKDGSTPMEEVRASLRAARSIMKKVTKMLKNPSRKVDPEFRVKTLKQVESAIISLRNYERMEESLRDLRRARKNLETGEPDADAWHELTRSLEKAREAESASRADRMRLHSPTKHSGTSKSKLTSLIPSNPFGPPKSKAIQFKDIIAEMNPQNRKMKEIEKMIRDRLNAFGATGNQIEIKFFSTKGNKDLDVSELRHLDQLKKGLAGVLASQIQGVFQQQVVNELEENYNVDDVEYEK